MLMAMGTNVNSKITTTFGARKNHGVVAFVFIVRAFAKYRTGVAGVTSLL
jgi:hypothetical protein